MFDAKARIEQDSISPTTPDNYMAIQGLSAYVLEIPKNVGVKLPQSREHGNKELSLKATTLLLYLRR